MGNDTDNKIFELWKIKETELKKFREIQYKNEQGIINEESSKQDSKKDSNLQRTNSNLQRTNSNSNLIYTIWIMLLKNKKSEK